MFSDLSTVDLISRFHAKCLCSSCLIMFNTGSLTVPEKQDGLSPRRAEESMHDAQISELGVRWVQVSVPPKVLVMVAF